MTIKDTLYSAAVCATAATLGTLATDTNSKWYQNLQKPSWQPPSILFPIVWTSLYAGTAWSVAETLDDVDEGEGALRVCLAINMALNAGWSYVFFRKHDLPLATAGAATLAASTWGLATRISRSDGKKAIPLFAYAGWTTFATALTAKIWSLNRTR